MPRFVPSWSLIAAASGALLLAGSGWAGHLIGGAWSVLPPAGLAERQLGGDAVRQAEEVALLRAQVDQLTQQLKDIAAIRSHITTPADQLMATEARVTRRDDRQGVHEVIIDQGGTDGVERGLPVALGWSLVGVVVGEQVNKSLVRLVTDRYSSIPAMLLDVGVESGSQVIAYGACAGTGDHRLMELRYIEDEENMMIQPGQMVVTAGGPGPIPRGMMLGQVVTARTSDRSDIWYISVQPWRDSRLAATLTVLHARSDP